MAENSSDRSGVVVAGHICIDVIPSFPGPAKPLAEYFQPGGLTRIGPVVAATGGPVANTGLALYRLGVPVELMGKVGGGLFGQAVIDILNAQGPRLARRMILAPDEPASYTIVINPPDVDRIFFHCPGPNDTFAAADLDLDAVARARIFHFGYPPIMRRMYLDGGAELVALLRSARACGATISLDMSALDPNTEAGQVPWVPILERALPFVDVFGPSIDETLDMLDRPRFDALRRAGKHLTGAVLHEVSDRLLAMGAAVVLLKLGDQGLYVRSSPDRARMAQMGAARPADLENWTGRELLTPCMCVEVGGTTGSGDCTVAGFLAGLLQGQSIEDALLSGVAVGACSVEVPDATSGVPSWERVRERLAAGWPRHPQRLALDGWRESGGLWAGPADTLGAP